jgi:hypothetical protein
MSHTDQVALLRRTPNGAVQLLGVSEDELLVAAVRNSLLVERRNELLRPPSPCGRPRLEIVTDPPEGDSA